MFSFRQTLFFILFPSLLFLGMGCGSGATSNGSGGGGTTSTTSDLVLTVNSAPSSTAQVDWIKTQFSTFGLVDSYQGNGSNTCYTYDQAMAILACSYAGLKSTTYFNDVRRLLGAMAEIQNSDGSWYFSYDVTTGTALDNRKISGQMAWMVIAIAHYQYWSGDTAYQTMMTKAVEWLLSRMDTNTGHETYGAINFGEDSNMTASSQVFSTEHNLDSYLALQWAGRSTEALLIRDYLFREMWAPATTSNGRHDLNIFWTGYNDFSIYTDPQTFANMMLGPTGPSGEPIHQALDYVYDNIKSTKDFSSAIQDVTGVAIYSGDLDTVWCEGTSQFELAARHAAAADSSLSTIANEMHTQIGRVAQSDGGIPFSFNESGSNEYPNDYRYAYIASVAWYFLNE